MNQIAKIEFYKDCRDFTAANIDRRYDLATRIIQRLSGEVRGRVGSHSSETDWTRAIFDSLEVICPQDCCHAPSYAQDRSKSRRREFLVDFIWEEEESEKRVLLACESEWSSHNFGKETNWTSVEEDFEKLLAIKAPFKLLVFSSNFQPDQGKNPDVDFGIEHARRELQRSLLRAA